MPRNYCKECEDQGFAVSLKTVYDRSDKAFRKIGQYCPKCFFFYPDEELRFRLAVGEENYKKWVERGRPLHAPIKLQDGWVIRPF